MAYNPPQVGDTGPVYVARVQETLDFLNTAVTTGQGDGTGLGIAVVQINGEPGPFVDLTLQDLSNVNIPTQSVDDLGNVVQDGPADGSVVQFDATNQQWVANPAGGVNLAQLDARYAPLGYEPPFNLKGQVLSPGELVDPALPADALIFDMSESGAGGPQPADVGIKSWTFNPASASNTAALTAGTLRLAKIPIRGDWSLTKIGVYVTTAGSGITSSGLAAYRADGTRIQTATGIVDENDSATDFTSTGMKFGIVAFTATIDQPIYVAVWTNGGTPPTMLVGSTNAAQSNVRYPGGTQLPYATGAAATSATPPAAMGTLTAAAALWACVI